MKFNYADASFDDLDEHAMQLLVFESKELSSILKGHLFIERILDTLIDRYLEHPDRLRHNHRLSFDFKVDLARAMGLLPERYVSPIKALNKIRNEYAHSESYHVSLEELNRLKLRWEPKQEEAFKVAATKGIEDAAMIATLFLTWDCMHLLGREPSEQPPS